MTGLVAAHARTVYIAVRDSSGTEALPSNK